MKDNEARASGKIRAVRSKLYFLDEDLANEIGDEDVNQPCMRGDECTQEYSASTKNIATRTSTTTQAES